MVRDVLRVIKLLIKLAIIGVFVYVTITRSMELVKVYGINAFFTTWR